MSEQDDNLERVKSKIGKAIIAFITHVYATRTDRRFHMNELATHVSTETHTAPASPDRILRELRRDGLVDYVVVSRKNSLYEVTAIAPEGEGLPGRGGAKRHRHYVVRLRQEDNKLTIRGPYLTEAEALAKRKMLIGTTNPPPPVLVLVAHGGGIKVVKIHQET